MLLEDHIYELIDNLRAHPGGNITVHKFEVLPMDPAMASELKDKWEGKVAPSSHSYFELPQKSFVAWSYQNEHGQFNGGEICLYNPLFALEHNELGFVPEGATDLWASKRYIDPTPHMGIGTQAVIDAENSPVGSQVTFQGPSFEALPMEISLSEYYEKALNLLGFYNWQYLWVEEIPSLDKSYILENDLKRMARDLPNLFPEKDCSQMLERLESIL